MADARWEQRNFDAQKHSIFCRRSAAGKAGRAVYLAVTYGTPPGPSI